MEAAIDFLLRHGYAILFLAVFLEQTGFPVPAVPLLLGLGALSADARFSLPVALAVAVSASLPADAVWFQLGRRRGYGVLRVLCRIAIEPDRCVRGAGSMFQRYGPGVLVVAKFVPGLNAVAAPMAGMLGMPASRFFLLDGIGAMLWSGTYLGLGYIFRRELEWIAAAATRAGVWFVVLAVCAIVAYLLWKWIDRRRFLQDLAMARITPEELKNRIDAGDDMTILDLRHSSDIESHGGAMIPKAIRFPPELLEYRHEEAPRDRDIVVYCS
jgi:membrane protein DedA with SNARE-associated domain